MMALCPNCHDEATQGAMPEYLQRQHKQEPYNIQQGYSRGLLTVNEPDLAIRLGGNDFVGGGDVLRGDGTRLVAVDLESGSCAVSVELRDQLGAQLLEIKRNEWLSGDPQPWDIEASYQRLCVRQRQGEVSLRGIAGARP
jgi:hypothetical protein